MSDAAEKTQEEKEQEKEKRAFIFNFLSSTFSAIAVFALSNVWMFFSPLVLIPSLVKWLGIDLTPWMDNNPILFFIGMWVFIIVILGICIFLCASVLNKLFLIFGKTVPPLLYSALTGRYATSREALSLLIHFVLTRGRIWTNETEKKGDVFKKILESKNLRYSLVAFLVFYMTSGILAYSNVPTKISQQIGLDEAAAFAERVGIKVPDIVSVSLEPSSHGMGVQVTFVVKNLPRKRLAGGCSIDASMNNVQLEQARLRETEYRNDGTSSISCEYVYEDTLHNLRIEKDKISQLDVRYNGSPLRPYGIKVTKDMVDEFEKKKAVPSPKKAKTTEKEGLGLGAALIGLAAGVALGAAVGH